MQTIETKEQLVDTQTWVSHRQIRSQAMGDRATTSQATVWDRQAMVELARKAFASGALGLNADRYLDKPAFMDFLELVALAEVCREKGATLKVTAKPGHILVFLKLLWTAAGIFRKPLKLEMVAIDTPWNPAHKTAASLFNVCFGTQIRLN